ncbi:MAG TPA: fumarylacetoacetate hydrolase family protein [Candidatus Dormibacteraeota bacterium]|jgi:2-keto-4-pentenoate hydratase/2-oxohepta-3-ene-1,7-dioic acid hydratase in catechol pathway|nr:fumarylacetoacetate hydrolase family protein [Candidatus Dormibacteraeota bacterium]
MRIIRYEGNDGKIQHAVEQPDGSYLRVDGDVFGEFAVTREKANTRKMLPPVKPEQIWCIGQNYRKHAEEVGMAAPEFPVVFAKGVNTVITSGGIIRLPGFAKSDEVDYEAELVVVIGKECKNVSRERALDYVIGYMCGNDVSARDWQLKKGGSQWCRGKSFDTFAPTGPCLVTKDEVGDPNALRIQTTLNGNTVQDANTNDMIFDVRAVIEFLSQNTTLLPGTLIFTGTPQGVGMGRKPPLWLKDGDEVCVTIEKIGTLQNKVAGS